jgi:hypothetical protein
VNRRTFLAALAAFSARPQFVELDGAPSLVRFPYIQNTNLSQASILWATDTPGNAFAEFSADGRTFSGVTATPRTFLRQETGPLAPFIQYQANVSGLAPGTMYVYRVNVGGQYLAQGRFRTAGPGPFRFAVMGDSGQGTQAQSSIARRLVMDDPSFLLHVGDIAYMQGSHIDFQLNHFNIYSGLLSVVPYFTIPGNHEYETQQAQPYLSVHSLPTENVPVEDRGRYYSFDWGNVHFVCLDSNTPLLNALTGSGEMLRWLERDLKATRQFWRVALVHHPPYASGPNQQEVKSLFVRSNVVPILEAYGVQLVFSGDEHSFQRSHHLRRGSVVSPNTGTVYVTTGGGGAFLYPAFSSPLSAAAISMHHYMRVEVDGGRMNISAVASDGTILHGFTISPLPIISDGVETPLTITQSGQGSLIRILGRSLATEERFVGTLPGPTELAGTSVSINGQTVNLIYVSGTQIWAHSPFPVQSPILLKITNLNGSTETSL